MHGRSRARPSRPTLPAPSHATAAPCPAPVKLTLTPAPVASSAFSRSARPHVQFLQALRLVAQPSATAPTWGRWRSSGSSSVSSSIRSSSPLLARNGLAARGAAVEAEGATASTAPGAYPAFFALATLRGRRSSTGCVALCKRLIRRIRRQRGTGQLTQGRSRPEPRAPRPPPSHPRSRP